MTPPPKVVVRVGTDRVCVEPERVVIEAAEPMDWPLHAFCRVPIYFEGRKYFLNAVGEAVPPLARRYELRPWPENLHEASCRVVCYDADYVRERDEAAIRQRIQERWRFLLLPLYPLLGLTWSGFKHGWLVRIGFEPRSLTSASVALTFNLFIVQGIFVGWLQGGLLLWIFAHGNLRMVDLVLTAVLAADSAMRYSQLLQSDVERYWGFGEWLARTKRRKVDTDE